MRKGADRLVGAIGFIPIYVHLQLKGTHLSGDREVHFTVFIFVSSFYFSVSLLSRLSRSLFLPPRDKLGQ